MKLAILGYGKMGRAIERMAVNRGHEVYLKINSSNKDELTAKKLSEADVIIEFSTPALAVKHILECFKVETPIVIGTTGWYEDFEAISEACKKSNGTMISATNFSVGVNLFFELNKKLAQLMNSRPEYKASITEIHHTEKLDSPSGTAISLAEGILENHKQYDNWVNKLESSKDETFPIHSIRKDDVKGTHLINYESDIDRITIEHFAKNRDGFALGAILAAEFIQKKIGIFSMQDVLKL